ncbi:hypothetical protein DSM112329_00045 [Paraconexibacter sp. AEG42_29]|uniref:Flagellar assembly protein FliH/Type III secretion system HrpE domain-containing protein n=1 Tax=Paraconexibacter sp. AEG42_29 TaxID=2997339 RepID=A0AAU7ANR3_9ACTN
MPTDFALPALTPTAHQLAGTGVADAVLAAAHGEADALREAARAEGYAAGLAAAAAEIQAAVAALHGGGAQLAAVAADLPDLLEAEAVELAFAIAGQVLGGALDARPELVVGVVRGGLRRLVERDRVTLLVHPDDLECVRAATPGLIAELGGMEHCEVQAERRVARGGAMVRTAEGEVDATLATKLSQARSVVTQALAEPAAGQAELDAAALEEASA